MLRSCGASPRLCTVGMGPAIRGRILVFARMLSMAVPSSRNRVEASRRCFCSLAGLALSSCKHLGVRPNRFGQLRSELRALFHDSDFWGTALVSRGDEVIFKTAGGRARDEGQAVVESKDRFIIGSISKQITASLVMRAWEQRAFSLTDPVAKYLLELRQPWAGTVTIHHLLTHTHGIQSVDKPLAFEVGSCFEYSQLGYDLLAQILAVVHNEPFWKLCTELFGELRLRDTFHPRDLDRARPVDGFERSSEEQYQPATESLKNYAAAGSLMSTVADLARWNQLLHSGAVVHAGSLERMSTRYATRQHPIFGEVEYGYGLLFEKGEQNLQIGALGYAPGFASACYYYPKQSLSLVVLSNRVDLSRGFQHAFRLHTGAMQLIKRS